MKRNRLVSLAAGALAGVTLLALMGPSGGYPSRLKLQTLTASGRVLSTSAQTDADSYAFEASSATPAIMIEETDASADEGRWDILSDAEVLKFRAVNDAQSVANNWLQVARVGAAVDGLFFQGSSLNMNGLALTPTETSSTGTVTGCTTAPTSQLNFVRHGNLVVVTIQAVSCTSNAAAFTLTGAIPAGFRPTDSRAFPITVTNNGANAIGVGLVDATATLTLGTAASPAGGGFTASGVKAIAQRSSFSYAVVP